MKFVLDTNVLSNFTSPRPERAVLDWIGAQPAGQLFTSSVTVHEIRFGIELMPKGRRRDALEIAVDQLLTVYFAGKILVLDAAAARVSGEMEARVKRSGNHIGLGDCMIAGIAVANGASVVTRNVKHFALTGATVVNPWGK